MLKINGLEQGLEIFRALGSDVRMDIVQLLACSGSMNLNAIASSLNITNGALTTHIRKLEEAGIIRVSSEHSSRGLMKVCSLEAEQLLFDLTASKEKQNTKVYETEINIGHYSDYQVTGPCGLAGAEALIGTVNDPRSFAYPERIGASMLYFHDGYIEYRIPNLLPEKQRIVQLTLSFEVSSAEQGSPDDTMSFICFSLNGRYLGEWLTIPADANSAEDNARGIYTPLWWRNPERQHGYLKMVVINQMGTFLDGVKIMDGEGDSFMNESSDEMKFRFEVHPRDGRNAGLALYGDSFGNYHQNIRARVHYMPEEMVNG